MISISPLVGGSDSAGVIQEEVQRLLEKDCDPQWLEILSLSRAERLGWSEIAPKIIITQGA
jgi:hypothetical protein